MVVQFLCPNGHKIRCEQEWAGKPAKCPKCGVKFRVPELSELLDSHDLLGQPDAPPSEQSGGHDAQSPTRDTGQIEFLCPNGHRLHAPRAMQGQPGQCPECGVHFRVPSLDEAPYETTQAKLEVSLPASPPTEESGAPIPLFRQDDRGVTPRSSGKESPIANALTAALPPIPPPPQPAGQVHPLASLLSRLWRERADGTVIELHLSDGQTMAPDRYAPEMSQGSIGVFALTDSNGTHTVTAVAWDSVSRIDVRGVKRLPGEFRQ